MNPIVRSLLIAAGGVLLVSAVIGFGFGMPHLAVLTGTVAVLLVVVAGAAWFVSAVVRAEQRIRR